MTSWGLEWHRSCWKPSSRAGLGQPGLGWDLLPQQPGIAARPPALAFPFPLLSGVEAPRQVEGCRQGWRGPTHNLHLCFFPHWFSDHLVPGWLR